MLPAALVESVVLIGALLVVLPLPAGAQSELQSWLNPELGKQIARSDYRFTLYPDQRVKDQDSGFRLTEHRITLFLPLAQDSANEFALAARTLAQEIDTRARFPNAGGRFPSELWDGSAGLGYRHKFDNNWIGGVAVTVGSASDEAFNNVGAMYFLRIIMLPVPHGGRQALGFTPIYTP